eukprot:403346674
MKQHHKSQQESDGRFMRNQSEKPQNHISGHNQQNQQTDRKQPYQHKDFGHSSHHQNSNNHNNNNHNNHQGILPDDVQIYSDGTIIYFNDTTTIIIDEEGDDDQNDIIVGDDWPPIQIPYNAEVQALIFQYNETSKDLFQYRNISVDTYIDTDGNRGLFDLEVDLPTVGFQKIDNFVDYTRGVVVNSIPSIGYCVEENVGLQLSLKSIIDLLRNPQAGVTSYMGKTNVDWESETVFYHQFHVQSETPQGQKGFYVFFDVDTLQLNWLTMDTASEFLIGIPEGMKPRTFTDKDYQNVARSCASFFNVMDNEQDGSDGFIKRQVKKQKDAQQRYIITSFMHSSTLKKLEDLLQIVGLRTINQQFKEYQEEKQFTQVIE